MFSIITSKGTIFGDFFLLPWAVPGCSKIKDIVSNVSLNFQTLLSEICQYLFVEQM